jgi:hypothetical protein
MSEDDIFAKPGDTYLRLIHPVKADEDFREALTPLVQAAASVPEDLVSPMIVGKSWRERLLGIELALAKCPGNLTGAMLQSLHDVRGISIVPTCAALAVLGDRGLFDMVQLSDGAFERGAFDGEVGWAIEKALQFVGGQPAAALERGPNYGQVFAHQVQVFEWILGGQQHGAANGRKP